MGVEVIADSKTKAASSAGVRRGPQPPNEDALKRLQRIQGQVAGLIRMVHEERYCIDILTQVTAVRAALNGVGLSLLGRHLDHCVTDAIREGEGRGADVVEELMSALKRASF